jgi:hypothetical protein
MMDSIAAVVVAMMVSGTTKKLLPFLQLHGQRLANKPDYATPLDSGP